MSEQYLHRGDAPFGDSVWEQIDRAVVEAAKSQLSGRRLLQHDGTVRARVQGRAPDATRRSTAKPSKA